jgi:hypothetical protein
MPGSMASPILGDHRRAMRRHHFGRATAQKGNDVMRTLSVLVVASFLAGSVPVFAQTTPPAQSPAPAETPEGKAPADAPAPPAEEMPKEEKPKAEKTKKAKTTKSVKKAPKKTKTTGEKTMDESK